MFTRSRSPSSAIKDLADNVTNLTRQLILGGDTLRELEILKHELDGSNIELAWEHQHVEELEKKEQQMMNSFKESHDYKSEVLKDYQEVIGRVSRSNMAMGNSLKMEQQENEDLKLELQKALNELHNMRQKQQLNAADSSTVKLRGSPSPDTDVPLLYQAGDSIEIFEYQEGKTALMPGIITEVLNTEPSTYNVVKLEHGTIDLSLKEDRFRKYEMYPPGTQAYYSIGQGEIFTVTVVEFVEYNHHEGLEVHGSYLAYANMDKKKAAHAVQAAKLHRYLENTF